MREKLQPATLYLVATPIGNLADISLRALAVLKEVDAIYCEDTRRTMKLLQHHAIQNRLVACPDFAQTRRSVDIVHALEQGQALAYVSDAGTPGLSDPGAKLANAARAAGFGVRAVPGASALLCALTISGFELSEFGFIGFPPRARVARQKLLRAWAQTQKPLIFFEAPHRVQATLADVVEVFGADAELLLARELSKLHEDSIVLSAAAALEHQRVREPKGEYTVIIHSYHSQEQSLLHQRLDILAEQLPLSQAANLGAQLWAVSRSYCYNYLLHKNGR